MPPRSALAAAGLLLGLLASSCSKTNNVNTSNGASGVGDACGEADDPPCERDAVCVLGYCRTPCVADAECPRDAACIGDGDFGCSLAWELGCSSAQPCDEPLSCDPNGDVGKCRNACDADQDCALPDYACVDGVCVP